jgi:hypothetical protein
MAFLATGLFALQLYRQFAESQAIDQLKRGSVILKMCVENQNWLDRFELTRIEHVDSLAIGSAALMAGESAVSSMYQAFAKNYEQPKSFPRELVDKLLFLRSLKMVSRSFGDNNLDCLRHLTTLEHLTLSSDRVSCSAVVELLEALPNLKEVTLGGTQFTLAQQARLRGQFPMITFQFIDVNWNVECDYLRQLELKNLKSDSDDSVWDGLLEIY